MKFQIAGTTILPQAKGPIEPGIIDWDPIQVGDLPGYLGLMAAIVAVVVATLSLRKQSQAAQNQHNATIAQLDHLKDETSRIRNLDERRHASSISAWPTAEDVTVLNNAEEPVYEVVVNVVTVQGAGPMTGEQLRDAGAEADYRRVYAVVPPGTWKTQVALHFGIPSARPGVEIGFTDHNNRHWIRRANGILEEVGTNVIDYFEVVRPFQSDLLQPR